MACTSLGEARKYHTAGNPIECCIAASAEMPTVTSPGQDAAPPPLPSEQKAFAKGFVSGAEWNGSVLDMVPQLIQVTAARNGKWNRNEKSQVSKVSSDQKDNAPPCPDGTP